MKYFVGVDVGSTAGKALLLDDNEVILASHIITVTTNPETTARICLDGVLMKNNLKPDDIAYVMGTGYGRASISFANQNISELSCHAKGAKWLNPAVKTVLDIGGQDIKVIIVRDEGGIRDSATNDRCAAGTGRFLEGQARALDVKVEEFSEISKNAENPTAISSQCSVFAESEVITQVNKGYKVADIVAGIHEAIAMRLVGLLKRIGLEEALAVTGGCAKNESLIHLVETKLQLKVAQLGVDPQIVGALGAALLARQRYWKDMETVRKTAQMN